MGIGFRQTSEHRGGKGSHHQISIVRGQFCDVPQPEFLDFIAKAGFDGWEEASWELGLDRCRDDVGAESVAKERVREARARGLEIVSISTHLQGQALGDEPSAKTLQFVGGAALEAYADWRKRHDPPRNDPYWVPAEVGRRIHEQALESLLACARLAHFVGRDENRRIPLPGFCGSPAGCWNHWFQFPPPPRTLAGFPIRDVRELSLELLIERFAPFFDACRRYGTTFDLECHPSERAMGDLESARDWLDAMSRAGYGDVVGFNFDPSHLEWQNVSSIEFIREFAPHIHCVHLKGVQVARGYCRAGLLGGHRDMGHALNGWNFVTIGSDRDVVPLEAVIVELNRVGFDGALTIEWEDNDVEKHAGAVAALENVRRVDHPPSRGRHDDALRV
jgi:sugar phosphate isomerase/epimerase